MRKRLFMAIISVALVFGICGCREKKKDTTTAVMQTEDTETSEPATVDYSDLAFDPNGFARSSMEVGGKKEITELSGIYYPITDDELSKLSGGFRYSSGSSDREYASLKEYSEIDKLVQPHSESVVYSISKDYLTSVGFLNGSDEQVQLGDLFSQGYLCYYMYASNLFEDGIYPSEEEVIPAILDTLGNPDYIIDIENYEDSDETFEGLHICSYEMIYDYGDYQICLSVFEEWFCMIRDDGTVCSDYSECKVDFNYYQRNGYLVHLNWELEDINEEYSGKSFSVIGTEGTIPFEDFIEIEENRVVEIATASDTDNQNDESNQEDIDVASEEQTQDVKTGEMVMEIYEYFEMKPHGLIIVGDVVCDLLKPGDKVIVIGDSGEVIQTKVEWMEMYRKEVSEAVKGETVGILLEGVERDDIQQGWIIYKEAE